MIELHQFPPAFGLPNGSPFCLKMETYLRMAGLPYTCVYEYKPFSAPKGKMPYIVDGKKRIGDSGLIIDHLKRTYGDPLDQDMSEAQAGTALALVRMLEEHFYWCAVYHRWIVPENFEIFRRAMFRNYPFPFRQIGPRVFRRVAVKQLYRQGIGRHSHDEIYDLGWWDLVAASRLLGHQPYFGGEKPRSVDAACYGFLANVLWDPVPGPFRDEMERLPNLMGFCERMKQRYYAGWSADGQT